jgi:hypothetical protein
MNDQRPRWTAGALLVILALAGQAGAAAQARQAPPPEYKQLVAALQRCAARLQEFERLKIAYRTASSWR